MVERASPVQLRKALELANLFVKMGVNFVPVPVANGEEQRALVEQAMAKLEVMEQDAAGAERSGDGCLGDDDIDGDAAVAAYHGL